MAEDLSNTKSSWESSMSQIKAQEQHTINHELDAVHSWSPMSNAGWLATKGNHAFKPHELPGVKKAQYEDQKRLLTVYDKEYPHSTSGGTPRPPSSRSRGSSSRRSGRRRGRATPRATSSSRRRTSRSRRRRSASSHPGGCRRAACAVRGHDLRGPANHFASHRLPLPCFLLLCFGPAA